LSVALKGTDEMLSNLGTDLDGQEARIRDVAGQIETLKTNIDTIERRWPNSVPSSIYGQYSQMVDEHNRLVDQHTAMVAQYKSSVAKYNDSLARFQADSRTYDDKINQYNALVTEGNGLAKTVGTTWFIIPVPRGGEHEHLNLPVGR
jgi:hypothetical protein